MVPHFGITRCHLGTTTSRHPRIWLHTFTQIEGIDIIVFYFDPCLILVAWSNPTSKLSDLFIVQSG